MPRQRFIQDPETGKLVPRDEYFAGRDVDAPAILGDMKPYKSPIDGKMVDGRAAHRAHMKQHGVIEVGNEKLNRTRPQTDERKHSESIKRTLAKTMSGYGW